MGLNVNRDVLALLSLQYSLLIFLLCYVIGKMCGSHSLEHQMWRNIPRAELRSALILIPTDSCEGSLREALRALSKALHFIRRMLHFSSCLSLPSAWMFM